MAATCVQGSLKIGIAYIRAALLKAPRENQTFLQVEEASRNLVDLFCADPSGVGTSWEQRHKHQIRGSAAVLKAMQGNPQRLSLLLKSKPRYQTLSGA